MALTLNTVPRFKQVLGGHQQVQDSGIVDNGSAIALGRNTDITGDLDVSSTIKGAAGMTLGGTIVGVTTAITGTANNALAISVPTQGANTNAGVGLTITADAGGSGTTGGAGGGITIVGGAAQGSGANNGGSITLTPGAKTGAGTAGSVVINGTWTASGKTCADLGSITTCDVNGGSIDGVTIGAASAPTVTNLGTVTTCDINGGSVDGTTIGAAAASSILATTIGASGNVTLGTTAANAGSLSLIQGAVASDPTFSITQTTNDVAIAQTIGDIGITAGDDISITATGGDITLSGNVGMNGTLIGITTAITGTKNNALAISIPTQGTDDANGTGITIAADAGGSGGAGVHNGGSITLTPGAAAGAGTAGSVVINGAWTAAGKTCADLGGVTTCDINGGSIDGVTIGAASAPTVTNLGSVTTCDINGGTIDGATIGGASAGAGTFAAIVGTSLDLNGNADLATQATTITLKDNQASALVIGAAGCLNAIGVTTTDDAEQVDILRGLGIKRVKKTVTLATDSDTTSCALTPGGLILSAAFLVSTEIAGLDSDTHTISLGVAGTVAKYGTITNGGAATTISKNLKAKYTLATTNTVESADLILTIAVGSDKTPSAGAVDLEVIYLSTTDLVNV